MMQMLWSLPCQITHSPKSDQRADARPFHRPGRDASRSRSKNRGPQCSRGTGRDPGRQHGEIRRLGKIDPLCSPLDVIDQRHDQAACWTVAELIVTVCPAVMLVLSGLISLPDVPTVSPVMTSAPALVRMRATAAVPVLSALVSDRGNPASVRVSPEIVPVLLPEYPSVMVARMAA